MAGEIVAKPCGRLAQLLGPAGLAACVAVLADGIQAGAVSLPGRRRIGRGVGGLVVALARAHVSRSAFQTDYKYVYPVRP